MGVGATLGRGEGHRAVFIYLSPLVACALNDGRPGTVYMTVTLRALVPGTHGRCSITICYMDSERTQDLYQCAGTREEPDAGGRGCEVVGLWDDPTRPTPELT